MLLLIRLYIHSNLYLWQLTVLAKLMSPLIFLEGSTITNLS